jgi:hypothetical protein
MMPNLAGALRRHNGNRAAAAELEISAKAGHVKKAISYFLENC